MSEQAARVTNTGGAEANSGGNVTIANASRNKIDNDQVTHAEGDGAGGSAVASNYAVNTNASGGTVLSGTGDVSAVGVDADTFVTQTDSDDDSLFDLGDQEVTVSNFGVASANSGGNVTIANASRNSIDNDQDADVADDGFFGGFGSAVNGASNTNLSDGTAISETGDVSAAGVVADTYISQHDEGDGGWFDLDDQGIDVTNFGMASATSGGNATIANASTNEIDNDQDAGAEGAGAWFWDFWSDVFASNEAESLNVSDGTAVSLTGDVSAVGVDSLTDSYQVDGDDYFCHI